MTLFNDTLELTHAEQRANELDLLAWLALFVRPVPLGKLFVISTFSEPHVPRWAAEACERLIASGEVRATPREDADDLLEVVNPSSAPIRRDGPGVHLHADHRYSEVGVLRRWAFNSRIDAAA